MCCVLFGVCNRRKVQSPYHDLGRYALIVANTAHHVHLLYQRAHAENIQKINSGCQGDSTPPSELHRLFYTGSKYFYQSGHAVELTIYGHPLGTNCVEVIAFDEANKTELPRVYLNEVALLQRIGIKTLQRRVQDELKEPSVRTLKKFKGVLPSSHQLMEEEKRTELSTHILSRLLLTMEGQGQAGHLSASDVEAGEKCPGNVLPLMPRLSGTFFWRLVYLPRDTDKGSIATCVYPRIPDGVQPVHVARRRHTTDAELKESVEGLRGMQLYVHRKTGALQHFAVPCEHVVITLVRFYL